MTALLLLGLLLNVPPAHAAGNPEPAKPVVAKKHGKKAHAKRVAKKHLAKASKHARVHKTVARKKKHLAKASKHHKATVRKKAKPSPKKIKAEASAGVPMDPKVKRVVDAMQGFYQRTRDFSAHFDQLYAYVGFHHKMKAAGQVVFRKPKKLGHGKLEAPAMRWDYGKPDPKSIVLTGGMVYQYDPQAQTFTKAPLNTQQLSTSVTFLWGVGQLAGEFYITRVQRPDLTKKDIVLQLNPKKPESFAQVLLVVDPKSYQVTQTVVVNHDGSTNHMTFSQVKLDQGVPDSRFTLSPPPGTQVQDLTRR